MQRRVQHDYGERQHEARVGVLEDGRVELAVAVGEPLHHAVDLLRLPRQAEAPQELSAEGTGRSDDGGSLSAGSVALLHISGEKATLDAVSTI